MKSSALLLAALLLISCAPKRPAPHALQPIQPGPGFEKVNGESADAVRGRDWNLEDMGFEPRVTAIEYSPIRFDLGSAGIRKDQHELLAAIAAEAKTMTRCTVTGHACPLGGPAFNQALSHRRAEAVVRSLRARGVRTGLRVLAFGEDSLATGEPADYWENRRVIVECEK